MLANLVLTCEHGGNETPPDYVSLFQGAEAELASHRGYDPGALELAQQMSQVLEAPLIFATTTRLLVELNRSTHHPAIFSEFSRTLTAPEKQQLIADHYLPYRHRVEALLAGTIKSEGSAVHLSVHSFTPVLNGVKRTADIGLLYDPGRKREQAFAKAWFAALRRLRPDLRLRRNYPYRGKDDGFTTYLRSRFAPEQYLGIEIEVNQYFPLQATDEWLALKADFIESLRRVE